MNEFFKERFTSDARMRNKFNNNQSVYRSSRNAVLAEQTPRETVYKRLPGRDVRPSERRWRDPTFTMTFKQAEDARPVGTTNRDRDEAFDKTIISAAMEVDVGLEKLLAKRRELTGKVDEIDRVLEYRFEV